MRRFQPTGYNAFPKACWLMLYLLTWGLITPLSAYSATVTDHQITVRSGSGLPVPVAFTVFKPDGASGQSFPLVLVGHGWGARRVTEAQASDAMIGLVSDGTLVTRALDRGYGVISFDYRGHGGSGGVSHLMDPRWEVNDIAAILDWAVANLTWIAHDDQGDPKIGLLGQSFGAAYHIPLAAKDRRIDAVVSLVTWHDLTEALAPNRTPKSTWLNLLYIGGALATSFKLDPGLTRVLGQSIVTNRVGPLLEREFRSHGAAQTCRRNRRQPNPIPTLLVQGLNDMLFNINQAVASWECLKAAGANVRLMAIDAGHVIPVLQPPNPERPGCGTLDPIDAGMDWLDEHLKGVDHAADAIPPVCWNIAPGEATYQINPGDTFRTLPPRRVRVGFPGRWFAPIRTADRSQILAGVPKIKLTMLPAERSSITRPTVFVGLGVQRANTNEIELLHDQVVPIRGTGRHELELAGIGTRLQRGDTVGLLYQGANRFFVGNGTRVAEYPVWVFGQAALPFDD